MSREAEKNGCFATLLNHNVGSRTTEGLRVVTDFKEPDKPTSKIKVQQRLPKCTQDFG